MGPRVSRLAYVGAPVIHILQGPPGAGKTTWAMRQITSGERGTASRYGERIAIVSADTERERLIGRTLAEAHAACLRRFVDLLNAPPRLGSTMHIIVDNTNTTQAEVAPYVALGMAYGHVVTLRSFPGRGPGMDVHNVPEHVYHAMVDRIAKFAPAPFWDIRIVPYNEDL